MSNSVVVLNEQVLEAISGGSSIARPAPMTINNSKTNNSSVYLGSFGMTAVLNKAFSGGAIGNISIGVQQVNQ